MKHFLLIIVFFQVLNSCKIEEKFLPKTFSEEKIVRDISKVEIEAVLEDSLLSIRAIDINKEGVLFFSCNNSSFGFYMPYQDIQVYTNHIDLGNSKLEFRAITGTSNSVFFISVGNPAIMYKSNKLDYLQSYGNKDVTNLVYEENHPKAFYDSMDFWNDQEGIAIGDPTEDCMSIIITRDGGETWNKLSCNDLPKSKEGEAAFAASDTNIAIVGDNTWVATGGKASRVLFSPDKGKTWEVFDTPIFQGKETTGMYSIDFYDELNGYAIGGDYTKPEDNKANKIRTLDGGKTWELVSQNQNPDYRSCVQYIPNSKAKELVAVGFKGIDYSNDSGTTWKHLSNEGFYTIRFLNDSIAYSAGKGRISKLIFK